MNYTDYARTQLTIARANAWDQRNGAVAEILADGILYVCRGIGKAWRATIGLFSPRAGHRNPDA